MQKKKAWLGLGRVLLGKSPLLSIEITKECPLACPGCYAYGQEHLGGAVTLTELSDLRGDALVKGVLEVVRQHGPLQVSIVGGEPLIRHRELSRILPELARLGIDTLVVTSAVVPIPQAWNGIPGLRVAVSIDGLRAEHDERRKPATYDRILENIAGRRVDLSWVVTRPMMRRPGYLDEYLAFWTARPEIHRIWISIYTPQRGEQSEEMLRPEDRGKLTRRMPELKRRYPQLLMSEGMARAFGTPPAGPEHCTFSKLSVNYTADLKTRIEPCFFGGDPDCSQCGCAITAGLHWLGQYRVAGPLYGAHLMKGSIGIGRWVNRLTSAPASGLRWLSRKPPRGGAGTQAGWSRFAAPLTR